jgi:hypothetical protein
MPLFRYVLFTGGLLLGLLFWTDWYFPKPVTEAAAGEVDRSIIRIHSSHRWPSAVRFDTSMPMPRIVVADATPDAGAATPAKPPTQAYAYQPPPAVKPVEKQRRRAKPVSRLSSRETRRVLASTQPNLFSW